MTGPTHRQYSICFAYIVLIVMFIYGVTKINYYLALPIILLTARAGALFPDLDHSWQNIGDKTTLNKIINAIIHITGGKHRSWQTHSIDICLVYSVASVIVPNVLFNKGIIDEVNKEVLLLVLVGFASGWLSHIFSDMLTSAGVRLICFINFKIKLVPKKIGKLVFNTGHEWESFNYKFIKIINIFLGITCMIFPIVINGTFQNIIDYFMGGNPT